ncbi:MAG: lasso peptide biosynthesis B2 protein [Pseudomonadota bacterium]
MRWVGIYALCLCTVVFVRLGLWVTKYQNLRRLLIRRCPAVDPTKIPTVTRVVRGVDRTARFIPDASCLTRAISCQAILSWKCIPSTISIGVRKGEDGALKAHAWVLWNDQVVWDGNQDTQKDFKKLLDLPAPVLEGHSL